MKQPLRNRVLLLSGAAIAVSAAGFGCSRSEAAPLRRTGAETTTVAAGSKSETENYVAEIKADVAAIKQGLATKSLAVPDQPVQAVQVQGMQMGMGQQVVRVVGASSYGGAGAGIATAGGCASCGGGGASKGGLIARIRGR